jgi:hypothetical protein
MQAENARLFRTWIRVAVVCGFLACIVYPLSIFVPMPHIPQLVLGSSFGPLLAVASLGLYKILQMRRPTVSAQVAAVSNVLAGAMVTAMIVVQLSVKYAGDRYLASPGADQAAKLIVRRVWDVILGLDVTFDVFIGLGTLLFGVAMLTHPRFGKLIGIAGILVGGVVLLGFNAATFPDPPKDAGLIDPGPIAGLWYLWVTINVVRNLKWFDRELGLEPGGEKPSGG